MTGKTLVAFATKGGATEEIALEILKILKGKHKLAVDVVNLRKEKNPDISKYENVILGAGVRMGKIYKELFSFLENDFSRKKLALFVVCGEAGDPKDHDKVLEKHLKAILSKNPDFHFVEFEVFGGRMKILWKVVQDSVDKEKISKWADKVGKKFSSKG